MKNQYERLVKRATYFAVFSAVILLSSKLAAWWITGSMSMLASVFDSGMDILTSAINLILIRYALKPADNEHTFGHGKAEPLAALIQSGVVLIAVTFLIFHSIENMRQPKILEMPSFAVIVTLISIMFTGLLLRYQTYVVRKTHSAAIKADMLHYRADFLLNIAVLIALVLTTCGVPYADPFFSLLISLYILYSVFHIIRDAVQGLMDRSLSEEIISHIRTVALSFPLVKGVHAIKTRQSGKMKFIQLHLEFDDDMRLIDTHTIADEVEALLLKTYPNSEILIHQDPVSVIEKERLIEPF